MTILAPKKVVEEVPVAAEGEEGEKIPEGEEAPPEAKGEAPPKGSEGEEKKGE